MFIHNDWDLILKQEFEQPYMKELFNQLHQQYETEVVYPPKNEVFHAFQLTPYSEVKVVILGQDPYHGPNQALSCNVHWAIFPQYAPSDIR